MNTFTHVRPFMMLKHAGHSCNISFTLVLNIFSKRHAPVPDAPELGAATQDSTRLVRYTRYTRVHGTPIHVTPIY